MPKQAFPLDNYFMYIQDQYLDLAEGLLTKKQVEITGRRDHLHIFRITEHGKAIEVEILLARRQVRKCTCDCLEDESGTCHHIAAALKYLSQQLPKRNKTPQQKKPREAKQLNSKTLLKEVSERELRNFVNNYFSLDERFSIAFKTHFAHKIQLAEGYDIEKYYLLVRRFWRSGLSARRGRLKMKQLEKYLSSLTGLAEDLQATKEIQECFTILFGIQRFLISTTLEDEIIHNFEINLADRLEFLLRSNYAPSLRRKHLSHLADLISEYNYEILDNHKNLFVILHALGEKPLRARIIKSLTQEHYEKRDLQRFLTLARIFVASNQLDAVELLVARVSHRIHFIEPLFSLLKIESSAKFILELAEKIYAQKKSPTIRSYLYQLIDSLPIDPADKEPWHIRTFKKNQTPLALLRLKEGPLENWKTIRDHFIAHFKKVKNSEALAMIYVADEQHNALMSLLHEAQSSELILNYAEHLPDENHTKIRTLIEDILCDYLDTHVGYPSAETITNFLQRLNNTRLEKLTWPIMQALLTRYKERKLLVSTIADVSV